MKGDQRSHITQHLSCIKHVDAAPRYTSKAHIHNNQDAMNVCRTVIQADIPLLNNREILLFQ